ncbi:MAG: 2-hydroxyhepta-2,4-diene-1,7-dioate isomerase [Gemmatales bacterium]|nr:MAG: 2-hydroxyhepta-2,4-diene-1,7-dioate isomerase [Gemmatales bacterium]
MQFAKVMQTDGQIAAGILEHDVIRLFDWKQAAGIDSLSAVLHATDPEQTARQLAGHVTVPVCEATLLAPVDHQEIWAAGVTYKRSQQARERESEGAARFYDLVYSAERPELFFKATAQRAVGPNHPVRIRRDSSWSVPEPEFALVVSPDLRIVGYTIGNDMSSRDIEGENPLYLPQAKVYKNSCAVGPVITLASAMPPLDEVRIEMTIERQGKEVFAGETGLKEMARRCDELVSWLARDNEFPDGVILLTGTGIVPPDDFTLSAGDIVAITITGIGTLTNSVEQAK